MQRSKEFKKNVCNLIKHEFKVMCCSKCRLKNSTRNMYTHKGFTHVFEYSEKNRGGGTSNFFSSIQSDKIF